jgi:hypothetical protein
MGSIGVYSNVINKVYDVLEAARASGQPLERVKGVLFGERDRVTNLEHPYIKLVLDDPPLDEEWTGAKNQRGGEYRLIIGGASKYGDQYRPYGRVQGTTAIRNEILRSEDLGTTWLNTFGSGLDLDIEVPAPPDGQPVADRLREIDVSPSSQNFSVVQTGAVSWTGGSLPFAASVYAKADGGDWVFVDVGGAAGNVRVWFNLATGAVGSDVTTGSGWSLSSKTLVAFADAYNVGTGWYRIQLLGTAGTGTTLTMRLSTAPSDGVVSSTGNPAKRILWRGAQVEPNSTSVHRYLKTLDAIGTGFDPAFSEGIMPLMEDVLNVLDSNHDAIVASSSGVIDMSLTGRGFRPIGDDVYGGEVVARFRTRFLSAGR